MRGIQWTWSAIDSLLCCASEVKHLVMKIEFSGDYDTLQPFPEIDLVEFFNGHPKLKIFEIHGAMFAALCQMNSLRNVSANSIWVVFLLCFFYLLVLNCLMEIAAGFEVQDSLLGRGSHHSTVTFERRAKIAHSRIVGSVQRAAAEVGNQSFADEEHS